MSAVERSIRQARSRLTLNRALTQFAWVATIAALAWSFFWLAKRIFDLDMPFAPALGVAAGAALAATLLLAIVHRVDLLSAAVALDQVAGLKERLSTTVACRSSTDEFVAAARRDAERIATTLSVRAHVPFRAPRHWPLAALALLLAVGLTAFLPPIPLFASPPKAAEDAAARTAVERERVNISTALEEQREKIRALAESNPSATDIARDLDKLDLPKTPAEKPDDLRRDAVKELESLSEKLAQMKSSDREEAQKQLKRMLAGIEADKSPSENDKLASSLASGDFAGAKAALEEMRKTLESAAKNDDPEAKRQAAEVRKKLDALSKQIAQAANAQQVQKELENKAGMSAEQAREMLEQLSKMDPDQLKKELDALKKRLGEKGLSKEQVEKLAQKLASNKEAMKSAQKLADALKKASQGQKSDSADKAQARQGQQAQGQKAQQAQQGRQGQPDNAGEPGEASAESAEGELADAQEQLNELELAEQQMNDLEARMAELQDLKDDIAAGNCQGPDSDRDRIGQQGPQAGLGQGGGIGKERMAHEYKIEKSKSRMQRGKIIGQMLVDGEQVKGQVDAEAADAVSAAVRDAADAIDREELPRQYEAAQRAYFDRLAGLAKKAQAPSPAEKKGDAKP